MSVKIEPSGRRLVVVEVEVPGTSEEVWQAIATGPGVSCWFVPTEIEEHVGGAIVSHFGQGMDARATVTSWEPPHRFSAESGDWGENAPALATEWVVEPRSGGTCVVRVVHSLFASNDDWDGQLESIEAGWPRFFRVLALYLTHYRGQHGSDLRLLAAVSEPEPKAWESLIAALGLGGAAVGLRRSSPTGVPPLTGGVEWRGQHALLLRLDEPAPGIGSLFAHAMGGKVFVVIDLYLYGDQAADAVARNEPLWNAWMSERFPPPAEKPKDTEDKKDVEDNQ
ncbi:MAG TPA: SRPBCC domain-containing protein [Thermoanaerobaculia bacterium]|nr:SRPBCC domain-containing protein [Thermoanaerobaculia bacterium]